MKVFRKHNRVRVSVCEFGFVFWGVSLFCCTGCTVTKRTGKRSQNTPKIEVGRIFRRFFFFLFWEYREINKSKTKETKTQNTHILAIGWGRGRVRVKGEVF